MGLRVIRRDSVRGLKMRKAGITPPNDWNDAGQVQAAKCQEVSKACSAVISAGVDVELSGGTQHFSLETHDQTNIDSMFTAVNLGATEYPYHADGNKCVMYPAKDIITLYVDYKSYVTQQTTYCNFLRVWINRETDPEVIGSIVYGSELPDDLKAEMQAVLEAANAQIQGIIGTPSFK